MFIHYIQCMPACTVRRDATWGYPYNPNTVLYIVKERYNYHLAAAISFESTWITVVFHLSDYLIHPL